jgi:hypothetical protein
MFFDNAQPHPSSADASFETNPRLGMMLTELWHDWFEVMSQVALQTHRACEFLAENGGPLSGRPDMWRQWSDGQGDAVDIERLKQCLQSMDPRQAERVVHAVQMMQAMENMVRAKRSRQNQAQEATW